jgi:hypothetical protein
MDANQSAPLLIINGTSAQVSTLFRQKAVIDYLINAPSYKINGNGTITDNVTGLMWQQTDGGEMTFERALVYCDTLTLAGYTDWRLPTNHELFSILNQSGISGNGTATSTRGRRVEIGSDEQFLERQACHCNRRRGLGRLISG